MGKMLVDVNNVESLICQDEKKIYIGKDMILTSRAKDLLRNKGITLVYGEKPETSEVKPSIDATEETCGQTMATPEDETMIKMIVDILQLEHNMTDMDNIVAVSGEVLKAIKKNASCSGGGSHEDR